MRKKKKMNFSDEKKVIYVDIGEMSSREAEEYICKLMEKKPPAKFRIFRIVDVV